MAATGRKSPKSRVQPRRPEPKRAEPKRAEQKPARPATLRAKKAAPMPQTGRTRTEEAMEQRLDTLEPGSLRYESLRTAIEFKRSWLELAGRLHEIANQHEYKEWGYRTLEAYAQHELHQRKDTTQKLLRSYAFLETHERRLLETAKDEDAPMSLPSFQALDVLAEARANPYLSERDYKELRDQVFQEDPSPSQVRKIVRERAPEPVKKAAIDPSERTRKCLALAERLYGMLLEAEEIPERISKSLEDVVGGLRQIIDE